MTVGWVITKGLLDLLWSNNNVEEWVGFEITNGIENIFVTVLFNDEEFGIGIEFLFSIQIKTH